MESTEQSNHQDSACETLPSARPCYCSHIIVKENLENAPEPSPAKAKTTKPTTKAAPKKRPSSASQKPPQKRQKKAPPKDDSGDELSSPPVEDSDSEAETKSKKAKFKPTKSVPAAKASKPSQASGKPKPKKQDFDTELSYAPTDEVKSTQAPAKTEDDSGSEMSVLIDEEPQSKKKRKSKDSLDQPKKTPKAKPAAEDDPDQEEIKRLQGWLVKCGIRKIWAFELKPYESSKAKIKHLKDMLAEVGMTGRYSLEKASNVKEQRELAADIEAVQEGNEIWGKDGEERSRRSKRSDAAVTEDDVDDGDSAPNRKLVRGPKRYDFLSSDGEESD
jgi:hypothetical protein